jgi:O-antigen/teichoic acid export membrane protein
VTRARRSVLAFATAIGGSATQAVIAFASAPLLVRWLGEDRYGAFRAGSDWLGYVGLLEFGVGGALQAVLSRGLGQDDRTAVVDAVRVGVRAYVSAAALMAVVALGLGAAIPVLTRSPDWLADELRTGCWIWLLTLVWLPLAPFRTLGEAGQRGYLINLLLLAQSVTTTGLALAFAALGWGLIGQFLAVALGSAPFYLGLLWDGSRRYPEVWSDPSRPTGETRRALWALSWPTLLTNLSGRLSLMTDNIMVSLFFGPAAVAPFYLTQRFIALAGAQVLTLGSASWAGLADLHFKGEREVFTRRLAQLTNLTVMGGVGLVVPLAIWNRPLVALWVGDDLYAGDWVTWLAAANAVGLGVTAMWGWPLQAMGLVRAILPGALAGTAVNVAASAAATAVVGLPGPLIGTLVAILAVHGWWALYLLRRHFHVRPRVLLAAVGRPLAVSVPYAGGLAFLADSVPTYDPAWPRLAALAVVVAWVGTAAVVYFALAWFLAFPSADRAEWTGRLRGWLRRPSGA